ncbi:MAG: outer membrane protein [Alphaproteobacteria bacterium]
MPVRRTWLCLAAPLLWALPSAALSLSCVPGQECDVLPLYLSGSVGLPVRSDRELAREGTVALGVAPAWPPVRFELEAGYQGNDADDVSRASGGRYRVWTGMANVYSHLPFGLPGNLAPHLGMGIGAARIAADGLTVAGRGPVDDTQTSFAVQAMAGLTGKVAEDVLATLGYRYFRIPDLAFQPGAGGPVDADYANHSVMLGLIFVLR